MELNTRSHLLWHFFTCSFPNVVFLMHLLRMILTVWSRGLTEKLTSPLLVRKFPPFYGTRWFIIAFMKSRHLFLSWFITIQSMLPFHFSTHPFEYYPPIYALVTPQVSPPKLCVHLYSSPYVLYANEYNIFFRFYMFHTVHCHIFVRALSYIC